MLNTNVITSLVAGLLADPGSSSKNIKALVEKAIAIANEIEYKVHEANEQLQKPVAPTLNPGTVGPAKITASK